MWTEATENFSSKNRDVKFEKCGLSLEAEKYGLGLMDVMASASYSLASSLRRVIGRESFQSERTYEATK